MQVDSQKPDMGHQCRFAAGFGQSEVRPKPAEILDFLGSSLAGSYPEAWPQGTVWSVPSVLGSQQATHCRSGVETVHACLGPISYSFTFIISFLACWFFSLADSALSNPLAFSGQRKKMRAFQVEFPPVRLMGKVTKSLAACYSDSGAACEPVVGKQKRNEA